MPDSEEVLMDEPTTPATSDPSARTIAVVAAGLSLAALAIAAAAAGAIARGKGGKPQPDPKVCDDFQLIWEQNAGDAANTAAKGKTAKAVEYAKAAKDVRLHAKDMGCGWAK
jgi:hypothetical protein